MARPLTKTRQLNLRMTAAQRELLRDLSQRLGLSETETVIEALERLGGDGQKSPEPQKAKRRAAEAAVPRKVVLAGKPCRHNILNCRVCKTGRWA